LRSYIVITSPSYGGAEKRFFDIFTSLHRSDLDVMLIAPRVFVERLKADHLDRHDVFTSILDVPVDTWSRLAFVRGLLRLLRSLPRGGSYHYPLNCLWPLHLGRCDQVSMSMVDCTRVPALFGGTIASAWSWFSFFFVTKIDVLSPAIFSAMYRYRSAPKMSLTPGGTYVVPSPLRVVRKEPTVILIGRLVSGKGVEDFLNVLPEVWERMRDRAPERLSFQIAGYGPLESQVTARVAALAGLGVPVSFVGYAVADTLFSSSAVVLSMQNITNYPSRVVAEAMMAGCGVIVRDTGDSRQFGNGLPGLLYCHAQLDASELTDQIGLLLERVLHEPGFSDAVRCAALNRFSTVKYIDYFRDVLGNITAEAANDLGIKKDILLMTNKKQNANQNVIDDFGAEWARFDQIGLDEQERQRLFAAYFAVFPWEALPVDAVGMDIGCGSGRWAKSVAPKIGKLMVVDPAASALEVARKNLSALSNVSFHNTDVDNLPVTDATLDFAYSLGVLHHVPNTALAIRSVARKLKPGAPFLIYLYYALDNRPFWFRVLWRLSNGVRTALSKMPHAIKHAVCEVIAAAVYWPLARGARTAERMGFDVRNFPLAGYRNLSYYTMRTDALDRFGTRLEHRFTREQIRSMLTKAGFVDIVFHEGEPYWCALGLRSEHD
jgi:ubiquinone/menaquinone biosynthesis C-methylase UbiE/glycosyltransferase involved in cell wall biosynthesis